MRKEEFTEEKSEKKYAIQRAGLTAAAVLLAVGIGSCEIQRLAKEDAKTKKITMKFGEEDKNFRLPSTKEKETETSIETEEVTTIEEVSEEESVYVERSIENSARDNENEIIEEETSAIAFSSEIETETQVETEKETESQSEPKPSQSSEEEKESEDKEDNHEHNFKVTSKVCKSNEDGTHTFITNKKCSCGEKITIKKKQDCEYGDWVSNGKEGEVASCIQCSYEQTRDHDVEMYTSYLDNENGTHTQIIGNTCNTCDYTEEISKKVEPHNCGEYYNAFEKGEESKCDSGCGYTQTRGHKINTEKSYEAGEDHQHKVISTSTCETCDYTKEETSLEDCIHEIWKSNGAYYEVSVCPSCGDEMTRNHSFDYENSTTTYIAKNDGTHIERITYDCQTCDEKREFDTIEDCVGTWTSIGEAGEKLTCDHCEAEQTRDHDLAITTEYKDNHNGTHEKNEDQKCNTCNYETHSSVNENCNYSDFKNNGANEKRTCGDCKHEDTRDHTMEHQTEHVDDQNGKTHTTIVKDVCATCDYEEEISKTTEAHSSNSPWENNNESGEKNKCETCAGEMTRDHTMKPVEETGDYQYVSNGQHLLGKKQDCATCDYTIAVEGVLEDCDLTGAEFTKEDGKTVAVTCPKCKHDETVHIHEFSEPQYEKDTVESHYVKITCENKRSDGSACSYESKTHEQHNWEPTGIENTWDHPNEKQVECNKCHDTDWVVMENTFSLDTTMMEVMEEETVVESQTEEIVEEETVVESQTEEIVEEETMVESQTEEKVEEETVVESQTEEKVEEETVVESQPQECVPISEKATRQIVDELAKEWFEQRKNRESQRRQEENNKMVLLTNELPLAKKKYLRYNRGNKIYC